VPFHENLPPPPLPSHRSGVPDYFRHKNAATPEIIGTNVVWNLLVEYSTSNSFVMKFHEYFTTDLQCVDLGIILHHENAHILYV
jgi:hypothetical protein